MTQHMHTSRRKALQLFAGIPLLPLSAALGTSGLLAACGGGDSAPATASTAVATITGVTFSSTAAPTAVADRATTFTQSSVSIAFSDGTTKTQNLAYNALYKTGDVLTQPDGSAVVAGGYYYPDGVTPIIDTSVPATPTHFFSDCPDGTSLLKLDNPNVTGIAGNTVFSVTQFEYKTADNAGSSMYGKLPSPIGIATLDQDKTTGAMSVKHYFNLPTQDVHGLWITCAGSLSPWNTHLSSEEYEPDAWSASTNSQFLAFSLNTFGDNSANPYLYGHVPEVTVNPDGTGSIKKHYCMGRISREVAQVMPDNRTVLMGDDATSGGMFMFVADVPGDLSSGSLYVAKLSQNSAAGVADGGSFTVTEMIKLGSATSREIEAMAKSYKATDIIDVKDVDPGDTSYSKINVNYVDYKTGGQQWVKVLPGMEKAAAFLETRRYAAILGATMEFTKFEGVTVNAKDKKAYIAISAIRDTMTADGHAGDTIQLTKISSGGTYEITLGTNASVGSDWVPQSLSVPTALLGEDITKDADGNTANIDKIANTDNVKFSEAMRTLFIGEDSGAHLNNYVWAYNVDTKTLSRILSVPAGAECVCLHPVDDLNGFAYVMSGFQHPGDWSFTAGQLDLDNAIKANWGDKKKSAVGYLSGIPMIG